MEWIYMQVLRRLFQNHTLKTCRKKDLLESFFLHGLTNKSLPIFSWPVFKERLLLLFHRETGLNHLYSFSYTVSSVRMATRKAKLRHLWNKFYPKVLHSNFLWCNPKQSLVLQRLVPWSSSDKKNNPLDRKFFRQEIIKEV